MSKNATRAKGASSSTSGAETDAEKERRQPGTSALEWAVAGISCLGLVAVIFYLLVSAFTEHNGPAQIELRALGVTEAPGHYIVEFLATNLAGQSVAAVEIRGELRDGEEVVEEGSVTLDYLPRNSEREGALVFRNDPAAHDLRLSVSGYAAP